MTLWLSQTATAEPPGNLAMAAHVSTSYVSGHESLLPSTMVRAARQCRSSSRLLRQLAEHGTQWVQFEWDQPISTNGSAVYWWDDHQGVRLPKAGRILYWDGNAFVPVPAASELGVEANHYNTLDFTEVTTSKVRLGLMPPILFSPA